MTENTLGICIVGTGDMAGKHANGWSHVPEATLAAVAGHTAARAEAFIQQWGLDTWHQDYRAAIARDDVDVVSICVPTALHSDIALFAAEQGKHILCEKPIALTLAEADRMIEAAQKNGVTLGVGFMRPHSPVQQALKRWVAGGRLGRPLMYHATDLRETRPKTAMHNPALNGSPLIDMGVHLFDSWADLFDSKAVQVFAQGLTLSAGRPLLAHIESVPPDTASITVRYASGDIGTLIISWGLPPGVDQLLVPDRLYGAEGLVEAEFDPTLSYQRLRVMNTATDGDWQTVAYSEENMYELEIADFARRLLAGEPPARSGQSSREVLAVALAAVESLESGRPVWLASGSD